MNNLEVDSFKLLSTSSAGDGIWTPEKLVASPTRSFFAASFPFFFLGECLMPGGRGLAGGVLDESANGQVSSVRLRESVEGWDLLRGEGGDSALSVSKLCVSIFEVVAGNLGVQSPLFSRCFLGDCKLSLSFRSCEKFWDFCLGRCRSFRVGCACSYEPRLKLEIPPRGRWFLGKLGGKIRR
jgi:hypothetical protein